MVANVFARPFTEQVDFFRQKINLPSDRYDDIQKSAHDKGFIVAGANKADLLNDLRKTIDQCIHDGKSLGWYQKNFDEIVKKHGWTGWKGEGTKAGRDWRTKVTYQTNMSTSYAAGRWQQLHNPDLVKIRPYLTYHHADGVRHPRPYHLSWNGFTAPRDHPFWLTHFAPNGWLCHCYISASSEEDYTSAKSANKHKPPDGWDEIDPKTGEQVGIDKGFGYAPGANVNRPMKDFIDQKLIRLDAPIGAAMWQALAPVLKAEQLKEVQEMVAVAAASMAPTSASVVAHVIEPDTIAALAARGVELNDAAIWLRDRELIHAIRDIKDARGAMLPLDVWLNLPNYLEIATPYLDTKNNTLLYAFDLPDITGKVVVKVNYSSKIRETGKRKIVDSNFIVTGGIFDAGNLKNGRYVLIK
jgi:hypothetical protein